MNACRIIAVKTYQTNYKIEVSKLLSEQYKSSECNKKGKRKKECKSGSCLYFFSRRSKFSDILHAPCIALERNCRNRFYFQKLCLKKNFMPIRYNSDSHVLKCYVIIFVGTNSEDIILIWKYMLTRGKFIYYWFK